MSISCIPAELNTLVATAVGNGAWTPTEVLAVVGENHASRSEVVDTLWALAESGVLVAGHYHGQFGFRPATARQLVHG